MLLHEMTSQNLKQCTLYASGHLAHASAPCNFAFMDLLVETTFSNEASRLCKS